MSGSPTAYQVTDIRQLALLGPRLYRYYQGPGRAKAVRSFLAVMASVVALGGCTAANQQTAASTQEPQHRYLCLQTAQKPGGYDEQAFATCMASWGYKEDQLHLRQTINVGR